MPWCPLLSLSFSRPDWSTAQRYDDPTTTSSATMADISHPHPCGRALDRSARPRDNRAAPTLGDRQGAVINPETTRRIFWCDARCRCPGWLDRFERQLKHAKQSQQPKQQERAREDDGADEHERVIRSEPVEEVLHRGQSSIPFLSMLKRRVCAQRAAREARTRPVPRHQDTACEATLTERRTRSIREFADLASPDNPGTNVR